MTVKEFYNWAKENNAEDAEIVYEYFNFDTSEHRFENFYPSLLSAEDMNDSEDFVNAVKEGDIKKAPWYMVYSN